MALRKGLMRMINSKLAACLGTWRANAAEARDQMMKLRRGLMRMIQAKQAAAFGTWRAIALENRTAMQRMKRALGQMLNRALAVAYNTWHWKYIAEKELKANNETKMKQALLRMQNRLLSSGWIKWREMYLEARGDGARRQELLKKAALRMKHRAAFMAWGCWQSEMRWGVVRAARAQQAMIEMGKFRVEMAFDAWIAAADAEKNGTAQASLMNPAALRDRIKILMSDPSAKAQFESTMIHNLEAQNEASMKEVQALKIKLAAQTKPDSKATRDLKSDLARVESTLQASQYHEKELERELQEQKDQVQRGNSRGAGQK